MHTTIFNTSCIALCIARLFACTQPEIPIESDRNVPVVQAHGKIIPKDSIADPVTIPVDWNLVKTKKAGEPEVIPVKGNTQPLGHSIVVAHLTEQICVPGQDTFKLPEVVIAIDSPYVVTVPKSIPAKEAVLRERNPYGFSALREHEGLARDWVIGITRDHLGNLWFATGGGGVSRYDGRSFTRFSWKEGIPLDFVMCTLEDHNGNLWFGNWGAEEGVVRYDGRRVSHFKREQGLVGNIVRDLIEDRHGNLWIATSRGVSMYDGDTFTNFRQEQGLLSNSVYCLHEDKSGNIWIGTFKGINKYDGKFMHQYVVGDEQMRWRINDIQEDHSGNLWIGTDGHGMLMFDSGLYIRNSAMTGFADMTVWDIYEDQSGQLWFGTDGKGILMVSGQSMSSFVKDDGLFDDRVTCFAEDNASRLWIGTIEGGAMVYSGGIFKHFTEQNGLTDNRVGQIVQGNSGELWFAMNSGGVNRFDEVSIAHYGMEQGLLDPKIWCMLKDRHGNLWWGGNGGGITRFDGNMFTHYPGEAGLPYVHFDLMEDSSGDLWMGTWSYGVTRFDGDVFRGYRKAQGILGHNVRRSFEDRSGNLWFGSENPAGLTRYDGETFTHFTTEAGLIGNVVSDFYEDPEGNLWIACLGEGVSLYNGENFIHLNENVGFRDGVYRILEDRQGNLWFTSGSSGTGISRLAAADRAKFLEKIRTNNLNESDVFITTYTYDDGFQGGSAYGMFEDRDGRIWVETDNMLTVFNPNDLNKFLDTTAPSIQLTDVVLFNEQIDWHALEQNIDTVLVLGNGVKVKGVRFDTLSRWYGMPQDLSLAYNNNHISFNFAGVTNYQPDQVLFQYKLEGQDANWSRMSSRAQAPYGNLSSGRYVFKVKALGSTGIWSEEFHFPFEIRPPWWKAWWAYTIYGLIFIFLIWRILQSQRARIARIEREKTRERELEQAKAIEKAYADLELAHKHLKATQTQLIHSEKMASLGELTAGIAHEIKNPLNFVNNFSEVSHELLEEMHTELAKGEIAGASRTIKDVISNLDKILLHGKRADSIVQSMLQHSRGTVGKKELTDINALVDEYLRLAYHGLRAKDKSFTADFHSELATQLPEVSVIPQDIGRVLLNLINNAFYAVNERRKEEGEGYSPTVKVTTTLKNEHIEICVSDNGAGIPQDVVSKIFQPFFTTKPTGQGTGLGLSLAYEIVTQGHGGSMNVESEAGIGTRFIVQIPLQ